MSSSSDWSKKYQQYPKTSYTKVKLALEKIGYNEISKTDEIAYFRRNSSDETELPVEITNIEKIPQLTICLISDINNLGSKFKKELWILSDDN